MSVSGNNGSCLADKTFFCCYGKFFNQFPVSHMYIRPISAFAKTAKICILAFCNSSQHAKVKDGIKEGAPTVVESNAIF